MPGAWGVPVWGRREGQQVEPPSPASVGPRSPVLPRLGWHPAALEAVQEATLIAAPRQRGGDFQSAAPLLGQRPGCPCAPRLGKPGAMFQENGLGLTDGRSASPLSALGSGAMARGNCFASLNGLHRLHSRPGDNRSRRLVSQPQPYRISLYQLGISSCVTATW